MIEQWRPVVGFEGIYQVSDAGLVRSLTRRFLKRDGVPLTVKGRVLKPFVDKGGYLKVKLMVSGKATDTSVHLLVLGAFVHPRRDGMLCRHLDGNPANNRLENLTWGTPLENRADIRRHGHDHNLNKTHCIHGHSDWAVQSKPDGRRRRICNACRRERNRRSWAKRRAS